MTTEKAILQPLGTLLRRYNLKAKTWRDLVEARFIEPPHRIAGSKAYGLRSDQASRLAEIASARRRLQRRYTLSGLAMQLALGGDRSQPTLVKHEIARRVRAFWGAMTRGLQRHAGLKARSKKMNDAELRTAAKLIAKKIAKKATGRNRHRVRDAAQIVAYIMISMMYSHCSDSILGSTNSIKELLLSVASFEDKEFGRVGLGSSVARDLATKLAFMLADIRDALSIDEKRNPVFRALTDIPDDRFWALFEIWPSVTTAMWTAATRLKKSVPVPDFSTSDRARFNHVILAVLVSYYDSGSPEVYDEFYSGSCASFTVLVNRLVMMVEIAVAARKIVNARKVA